MILPFIEAEKATHDVKWLCTVLDVARSSFYAWRTRCQARRSQEDECLLSEIVHIHAESGEVYGSPRIHAELRRRGRRHARKRVARLMKAAGLQARRRRKYRRARRDSALPIAPNLLDRRFGDVTEPHAVWIADVTYVKTDEGWLYLAVVIDLYTRRVVGWAMGNTPDAKLTVRAYEAARMTAGRSPKLFHSDRGSEYACADLRGALVRDDVTQSMSRAGDCWDNAVAEAFFASLKRELVHLRSFATRTEARGEIFMYVEGFYNQRRLHSSLGYKSPIEFETETGS